METINIEKKNGIPPFYFNKPIWLLFIGIATLSLSHFSWNIDILAWISLVPFLLYLRITKGWKSRLIFLGFLVLTWSVIVLKIITEPIPHLLIPLYSVPISLIHYPGYLLYSHKIFRKYNWLAFPALLTILEWLQYTFTPLGSWGVAAYTQAGNIYIIQILSVFGMAGLSFLIYWVNSSIADFIMNKYIVKVKTVLPLAIVIVIIVFGYLRADLSKIVANETMTVAAIGTDSDIGGPDLPTESKNTKDIQAIFNRTRIAANAGAEIAVWNEASFLLTPDNEKAWQDSISALAKDNNISIVAAYVVLLSESPFRYENKYVFFSQKGNKCNEYLKHEPVPGEPAVKGRSKLETNLVSNSHIGGAICYDYDFPYLARANYSAGADIVALPSSDWRGIDPLHTEMAAFRAIEQGHSIIRSTRFGLSAAINPYGEMTARMSSFDKNNKILIASLPSKGITTIYSIIGDLFVYFCIAFIVFVAYGHIKSRLLSI